MSRKKKLTLSIIAVVCALSIAVGGTLMLFTDTTDIATNVVTLSSKPLKIVMQEAGWADRDKGSARGQADFLDTVHQASNDVDGDNYWEYTDPRPTGAHGKITGSTDNTYKYYQGPHDNEWQTDIGYEDINTNPTGGPNPHLNAPTDEKEPPFYGIEFPDNLTPGQVINKAPRVVHISGVDSYLRVLAKLNIYEWGKKTTDASDTTWNLLDNVKVGDLRNKNFGVLDDGSYALVTEATNFYDDIDAVIATYNSNDSIQAKTTAFNTLEDKEKAYFKAYVYKDPAGNYAIWKTFGEFLDAFLSDGVYTNTSVDLANNKHDGDNLGGIDYNDFNWKYVVNTAAPSTEGYYYYINSESNPESIYTTPPSYLYNLRLSSYFDFSGGKGENQIPLATFGGDEFPTAPIFTTVQVPNFTNAMQSILSNYKFTVVFEAQAVQKEGNGNENGSDEWATYFAEVESQITTDSKIDPNVLYNESDTNHDNFVGTPARDYPYPTITPETEPEEPEEPEV
ncbi:MAG: SipW-dependent-type signal peptide-containing protein [Clostridiales bacterium]|jgi:predicted ribosomally synthesized peptide with SipW-like signal peptide|nr:SipW-dependent-type signal peptide-containing protein [Clostridiales bacterium]